MFLQFCPKADKPEKKGCSSRNRSTNMVSACYHKCHSPVTQPADLAQQAQHKS